MSCGVQGTELGLATISCPFKLAINMKVMCYFMCSFCGELEHVLVDSWPKLGSQAMDSVNQSILKLIGR